jgi:4-amino-4-deoxychorismate lyase
MTMASADGWVCLNAADNIVCSARLDNRGLAYGDGFFTTMGVTNGEILWSEYHQQRICSHAQALQLDIDSKALLTTLLRHAQQLSQGILKLIVTRAPQAIRGYGFSADASGRACELWLKSIPMPLVNNQLTDSQLIANQQMRLPNGRMVLIQPPMSTICLTSQIACLPPSLAGLKTLNRLDNVLASGELQRLKALRPNPDDRLSNRLNASFNASSNDDNLGEGLLRDMTGSWVEGTMSNVFYQLSAEKISGQQKSDAQTADEQRLKNQQSLAHSANKAMDNSDHSTTSYLADGQWFTPPLTQSGVAGVMRHVLMDALSKTDRPVITRTLQDEDLPNITRLFFCNAVRGMMPVTRLIIDRQQGYVSLNDKGFIKK